MNSLIEMTPVATMSSREIAELTGKQHAHVLRDIRTMLDELKKDDPNLDDPVEEKDARGYTACIHLNRELTDCLLTGYSAVARMRVIKRWRELEQPVTKTLPPTKVFTDFFRVGRLIGLDKNAAAISANQATVKLTNTNLLQLMGQTHLLAEKQAVLYTPTELGQQFLGGISARKVNLLLAEAGLQAKKGEHWAPMQAAEDFCRVLDTGKRHGDGTPVVQVKWFDGVVKLLQLEPTAA